MSQKNQTTKRRNLHNRPHDRDRKMSCVIIEKLRMWKVRRSLSSSPRATKLFSFLSFKVRYSLGMFFMSLCHTFFHNKPPVAKLRISQSQKIKNGSWQHSHCPETRSDHERHTREHLAAKEEKTQSGSCFIL